MMRVAILGGGIAGLASAYKLARAGASVTLYESSDRLGGIATWFEHGGLTLDCFYHVILGSDTHLCGLLDELGLRDELRWTETGMGFFVRGKSYPFNTPADLLRFGALSFFNRLRTGFAALYITKLKRNGQPLDEEYAHVWLRRLFGGRVYSAIWEPLLTAKFGDLRDQVPAYWIWNTLNREKDGSQEVKGYVRGGYALIAQRLQEGITAAGGVVRLNTPAKTVESAENGVRVWTAEGDEPFDAAISTLPLPLLSRIAGAGLTGRVPLPDLQYQGVVNVLLVSRKPLDRFYWTAVVDSDFPFQGVVETTHVIDPEWIGGRHLLYVMNYCSADSPLYKQTDEALKRQALDGLKRLYPGRFDPVDVESVHVFRTPHVEPVWPLGYLKRRPAPRIDDTRVYLATTAQAYPMVTSWNTSVKLAEDAVRTVLTDLSHLPMRTSDERSPAPLA